MKNLIISQVRPAFRLGLAGACLVWTLFLASAGSAQAQLGDFVTSGLWMGDVTLQEVSQRRTGQVEQTVSRAQMRIILHVDSTGTVRLLKEAIVAEKSGTLNEFLIFSDPAKLAGAPVRRDVRSNAIAERYSAAAYDFEDRDGTPDNALKLDGSLARNGVITGALVLGKTHPANPFRHAFHPDHANDGARGYEITRNIKLTFGEAISGLNGAPQFTAAYEETISGLHSGNVIVRGQAVLTRVSTTNTLNP